MYSEHEKDILLQTELHTYKLLSYSWLCKYPRRDKQINTGVLTQQIQIYAVMKSSHLSSGICLLWLWLVFLHFLSTPNIESTLFKKSSMENLLTLLLHPQAADLWVTGTASKQPPSLCRFSPSTTSQVCHSNPWSAISVSPPVLTGITFPRRAPVSHSQPVWFFIN